MTKTALEERREYSNKLFSSFKAAADSFFSSWAKEHGGLLASDAAFVCFYMGCLSAPESYANHKDFREGATSYFQNALDEWLKFKERAFSTEQNHPLL